MENQPQTQKALVAFLAWTLIAAGLACVMFVSSEAYLVYTLGEQHHFIAGRAAAFTNAEIFSQQGATPFILRAGGAEILAFILFAGFGFCGLSLGFGLVRSGLYILSPQFAYKLHRLKQRIGAVADEVRSIRITTKSTE